MPTRGDSIHPSDEALAAIAGRGARAADPVWTHVRDCPACGERARELEVPRNTLRRVGAAAWQPGRNLARAAMRQLRGRDAGVNNVNELFAVLRTLVQGLGTFFIASERQGARRGQSTNADERQLRG